MAIDVIGHVLKLINLLDDLILDADINFLIDLLIFNRAGPCYLYNRAQITFLVNTSQRVLSVFLVSYGKPILSFGFAHLARCPDDFLEGGHARSQVDSVQLRNFDNVLAIKVKKRVVKWILGILHLQN